MQEKTEVVVTKEKLQILFEQMIDIEEEIKSQREDMKDAMELFSEQNGVDMRGLKKTFSEYKAFLKNAAEYHLVDGTATELMSKILGDQV